MFIRVDNLNDQIIQAQQAFLCLLALPSLHWPHVIFVQCCENILYLLHTLNITLFFEYVQFQSIRSNGFVVERT